MQSSPKKKLAKDSSTKKKKVLGSDSKAKPATNS
jgi:hypothetical protein